MKIGLAVVLLHQKEPHQKADLRRNVDRTFTRPDFL